MITTEQLRPHRFLTLRLFLSNLCGLLLAVLLLSNTANSATVDPDLSFLSNFETGDIQARDANPDGWSEQACYDYSFEPVTSPVRAGNYAIKIFLRKSDKYECFGYNGDDTWKRARAQLVKEKPSEMLLQHRKGNWLGFSVFIPNDWPKTGSAYIFEYFHNLLYNINSNGTETVHNRWGSGPGTDPDGTADLYVGAYSKGEWVDWVVYYYPSWESDGVLKIWRNEKLIANKSGANCMEGRITSWSPAVFKLYKPRWKITSTQYNELTIYFDEIRMARGADTQEYYNLVAPPPRSQVPVPTKVEVSPGK